jgi:hypothetical protein
MPGDQFFGGVGVDMLYPSGLGINHTFSEPEWNPSNIVSDATFDFIRANNAQAPLPADFETTFAAPMQSTTGSRPPPIEVSAVPPHMLNIPRPKSSPSTFGPNVEDLLFPENPYKFGGRAEDFTFNGFPLSPAKTTSPYFGGHEYSVSARTSPARHAPIPIAPDPVGLRNLTVLKRMRDEEEQHYAEFGQRKRKRAVSNAGPVELNEEEQLLLKLKEEENLPWKDIAVRFQTDLGKTYQVPALQMRFKRLRERMRTWTETDVSFLLYIHPCFHGLIFFSDIDFSARASL